MPRPWVLLGLAGVLLRFHPERRDEALAALSGLAPDTVRARLEATAIGERLEHGEAGPVELASVLSGLAGRPIEPEEAASLWLGAYAPDFPLVLALPVLARTHRLGVFANDPPLATRAFNASLFERVLFAAELGARKPESASFEAVARRLDAAPGDIVLVDADPACLEAARAAGWGAVRFTGVPGLAAAVAAASDASAE